MKDVIFAFLVGAALMGLVMITIWRIAVGDSGYYQTDEYKKACLQYELRLLEEGE